MAASLNNTTLRHILTQQKPIFACKVGAGKNSKKETWPFLTNERVTIWEDFNLDNLNESYGHILDHSIPEHCLAVPSPGQVLDPDIKITKCGDINYLINWNNEVLGPALKFARERLNLHRGVFLRCQIAAPDKSETAWVREAGGKSKVDHYITLDEFPRSNLVVGLGRPSSRFQGRTLASQPPYANKETLWPLRQLAQACMIANTRYGYILTEEDLVACCFSRNKLEPKKWRAALMLIPWSRHGENQLTTDLALWWLSMLAMSAPHNRAIVDEDEMVRINKWDVCFLDEERGWVRRHGYSNLEEPVEPPSPPAYHTPSPGNAAANAAAFAAHVGINADPLFSLDATVDPSLDVFNLDGMPYSFPDEPATSLLPTGPEQ
ncbi:hypothetical protein GGR51DRAFT_574775 [Nemania sp. FL0031]|nr:hypothetical protein GGR51DRAFT_574775 [Nemania sp. FL0031]